MFSSLSSARRMCSPFIEFSDTSVCSSRLSASISILNGTWITNVVPTPFSLSKVMVPPIFSTSFLVIGIPRPVPVNFVRLPVCSCAKGSNTYFWNSSVIPIPVSRQTNSIVVVSGCSDGISRQLIWICPFSLLYFTALDRIFIITRFTYLGLPIRARCLISFFSHTIRIFCSAAICSITTSTSSKIMLRLNGLSSRTISPDSSLLMSRTSFTSSSSRLDASLTFVLYSVCFSISSA